MYSYGYCYGVPGVGGNPDVRGYNQAGIVKTRAAAEREIKRTILKSTGNPDVTFKESESKKGSFRAWLTGDGVAPNSTNYVYFKLPDTWLLVDTQNDKFVQDSGSLDDMKFAVRKYLNGEGLKKGTRQKDNINYGNGVYLVKVH